MKTSSYHSVNAKIGILPVIVILFLLMLLASCTVPDGANDPSPDDVSQTKGLLEKYASKVAEENTFSGVTTERLIKFGFREANRPGEVFQEIKDRIDREESLSTLHGWWKEADDAFYGWFPFARKDNFPGRVRNKCLKRGKELLRPVTMETVEEHPLFLNAYEAYLAKGEGEFVYGHLQRKMRRMIRQVYWININENEWIFQVVDIHQKHGKASRVNDRTYNLLVRKIERLNRHYNQ